MKVPVRIQHGERGTTCTLSLQTPRGEVTVAPACGIDLDLQPGEQVLITCGPEQGESAPADAEIERVDVVAAG